MSILELLLLIFSVQSFASPLVRRGVPSFAFPGDVPFTVPTATLAGAFTCPNGNPTSSKPPVLLVHGTGSTGSETWGDGYVPALWAKGYTPCYVTLPDRAMGDMQISSEYVAYAIHMISYLSGGLQTGIVSHSQGGPNTQWALRFWPSTQNITRAFIPLSPDFAGIQLLGSKLSNICLGDLCQACIWQQSQGSNFLAALHDDTFQSLVPMTTVWSSSDGVVNPPQQNAQVPGATVLSVQQLCPLRIVTHVTMTVDPAGFALALDALNHGGIGSVSRAKAASAWNTCLMLTAPNMHVSVAVSLADTIKDLVDGFILGSARVSQEPPVMPYAIDPGSISSNSTASAQPKSSQAVSTHAAGTSTSTIQTASIPTSSTQTTSNWTSSVQTASTQTVGTPTASTQTSSVQSGSVQSGNKQTGKHQ